ncbi:ThiF family protein [Oesophagostomum dentatum]|uniref:NEDD8-activating enzyme E1 catalytic subunit n=1 Tax=Oesophagostomum dentatum TaxID=61180 RepID=A0A0B1SXD0_OESDE|nr:ThiF family protein [Oesophagostomum dentatum]
MADSVCSDPLAGDRWRDIRRLTDRPSGYAVPWFEPGPENMAALQKTRVLVIGAGGLGCELLKNLALSGFQNIDVIDMDTIDISAALDSDDPAHVDWVLNKALVRAQHYGIKGVDRRLTQGVIKRIIPAVASTNAVIAASCALEAIKLATNTAKPIDNYLNFTDIEGVYCGVVQMERDPECPTCSGGYLQLQCQSGDTLQDLIDKLVDKLMSDVGKSKAEVAAAFVQSRVSGCTVTALCDLVLTENGQVDTSTVIPLIDGGTEGFKGNARVIYPKMSACIDCTLDLFPPQVSAKSERHYDSAYLSIFVIFHKC